MPVTTRDLIHSVRKSRAFLFKHLKGLTAEQWVWKPYQESKSIAETLKHLVVDDRFALYALEAKEATSMEMYEVIGMQVEEEAPDSIPALIEMVECSFESLMKTLLQRYGDCPLDTEIYIYGEKQPLATGIPYLSSEDYYHAGQIGYIRLATDPSWDYYGSIYGEMGT